MNSRLSVTTISLVGVLWSFGFVLPEAIQAVYFGAVFQRMDSFVVGGIVFTITTLCALIWIFIRARDQLALAFLNSRTIAGANITNAAAWVLYFVALQRIEPVIAFTIFSGMIQLTTVASHRQSACPEGSDSNKIQRLGNALLGLGMFWLALATLGGWSGFTRGATLDTLVGLGLATSSGALFAGMLAYCERLNHAGVTPIAQIGLRFPLYIIVCLGGAMWGIDAKEPVPMLDAIWVVVIAIPLMSFPIFSLQKAISTASPLTIGAITALGPFLVFVLQSIEGRVDYATATLIGLIIYFLGAVIVVAARGSSER